MYIYLRTLTPFSCVCVEFYILSFPGLFFMRIIIIINAKFVSGFFFFFSFSNERAVSFRYLITDYINPTRISKKKFNIRTITYLLLLLVVVFSSSSLLPTNNVVLLYSSIFVCLYTLSPENMRFTHVVEKINIQTLSLRVVVVVVVVYCVFAHNVI